MDVEARLGRLKYSRLNNSVFSSAAEQATPFSALVPSNVQNRNRPTQHIAVVVGRPVNGRERGPLLDRI